MENSQAALLTLGFLLFLKGCETLTSEHSTNLAVGVGEDVQLKINPPVAVFSVTWYFGSVDRFIVTWNGVSVTVNPPYQGRVELNKNTGTLTLKNVSRSDSGDYLYQAVSIATGHPVQYNGSIALNVYQPITNVNVKPNLAPRTLASERSTNLAVGVGEDVQLKINPPVAVSVVTWYFGSIGLFIVTWNGVSETVNAQYQGRVEVNINTGTLTLKNVSRSDSGDYLYQAVSTSTGHPVQHNGNIALNIYQPITNVNVKPSLAQPIANQALNLTCEVLGSQTVSSRLWLKEGQRLSTSDRITLSVDSSVVSFNPVLQSDNGEYQCKASNPVSEVTSTAYRLEVNYGPEQASITGPDSAAEGSSVTFTCSAQSLPPCSYTWYFNETETAQGSQYKITSVTSADRGSYTCVAWNSVTGRNSSAVKEFIVTGLGSLSSGEIAGIVIGTLAGVTGVALGVYFSVKLCRNNPHDLKPGPAQSSPGAVTYENFKGPSASATYENTTAIRRAGEAENPDSTYTGLQFPDQSTYSTLNRP